MKNYGSHIAAPSLFALVLFALVLVVPSARVAAAPDARASQRSEAEQRFDRAFRLGQAGDLSGALAEFKRVAELAPSAQVSFNVGLFYALLGRPVEARRELARVLSSPDTLTPAQRERAAQVHAEQAELVAQLRVELNIRPERGVIEIDNVEVATLPRDDAIEVPRGLRVVGVVVPGHAPVRRELALATGETHVVKLDLVAIDGRLAHIELRSSLPGADVFVDGTRVGRTPLESSITVLPGTRVLRVERAGYRPYEHTLALSDGARAPVTASLEIDPVALSREGGELAIKSSETHSVAEVDGASLGMIAGPVRLPRGPHRVRIQRPGFEPAERDIDVPLGDRAQLSVQLEPLPETRLRHLEHTRRQRRIRGAALGLSGLGLIAGVAIGLVANERLPGARADLADVEQTFTRGDDGPCDPATEISEAGRLACDRRLASAEQDVDRLSALRGLGFGLAGVAAAGALTSGIMLWLTDDPHRYDPRSAPSFSLSVQGLELRFRSRF